MVDKSYQQKQKEVINYKGVNMNDYIDDEKGTYQLSTTMVSGGDSVYETIIDTRNGKVVSRRIVSDYPKFISKYRNPFHGD